MVSDEGVATSFCKTSSLLFERQVVEQSVRLPQGGLFKAYVAFPTFYPSVSAPIINYVTDRGRRVILKHNWKENYTGKKFVWISLLPLTGK